VGHCFDRVRGPAGRSADADVVERVDKGRIPVVEVPAEVLQQDERDMTSTEFAYA